MIFFTLLLRTTYLRSFVLKVQAYTYMLIIQNVFKLNRNKINIIWKFKIIYHQKKKIEYYARRW